MEKIEDKKKYFIIGGISLLLIVIAIIVVLIFNNINLNKKTEEKQLLQPREFTLISESGIEINKSEVLKEVRKYNELDITGISLTATENSTRLTMEFKNNTNQTINGHTVKISMLDKAENKIVSINGYLGTILPGESYTMPVSSSGDFVNAYNYTIEKE